MLTGPLCLISPQDVRLRGEGGTPLHPPHPTSTQAAVANLNFWVHNKHFWIDTDSIQIMRWRLYLLVLGVECGVMLEWIFN